MKKYKVHCITRDSLGEKVTEYDTYLDHEAYANLMAIAELELDSGIMLAIKDVEVDGELGSREFYLY